MECEISGSTKVKTLHWDHGTFCKTDTKGYFIAVGITGFMVKNWKHLLSDKIPVHLWEVQTKWHGLSVLCNVEQTKQAVV